MNKNENNIQEVWNGFKKGMPVRLIRDVYHRMDGTTWGGIYYDPPGKIIAKRGIIGRFLAKTDQGVLVQIDSGSGSILGLVLDHFVIEHYEPRKNI